MTYQDFDTDEQFVGYYNQWMEENRYEVYYPASDFPTMFGEMTVNEFFSKYGMQWIDDGDWFYIDDYGRFSKTDLCSLVSEALGESSFMEWLEEQ